MVVGDQDGVDGRERGQRRRDRVQPARADTGDGETRSPHTGSASTRWPSISNSTDEWPNQVTASGAAAAGTGSAARAPAAWAPGPPAGEHRPQDPQQRAALDDLVGERVVEQPVRGVGGARGGGVLGRRAQLRRRGAHGRRHARRRAGIATAARVATDTAAVLGIRNRGCMGPA